ncbi:MAG: metallophosphoesterase family protein [Anaerolineales bacterium]|nr:metallophosphoesterase family protein [Anaerolineales bacterium]MCA9928183.1 metallophosphoesterase family protein [Anaerolineales bacterium]
MKILAVSDKVLDLLYCSDVRSKFPGIDLLVGCGDLPFYYLEFLVSAMDRRLVFVRGNHDVGPQYTIEGRILEQVQGGIDIHTRVVYVKRLLFAGLEGSMRYRPNAPFMYTEGEMRANIGRLLPRLLRNRVKHGRYLDILVAHSPPFGIHDKPDLPHTGFKIFLSFLEWFKPRYFLHGHIHIYRNSTRRISRYDETTIINVYPHFVLDLENPPLP